MPLIYRAPDGTYWDDAGGRVPPPCLEPEAQPRGTVREYPKYMLVKAAAAEPPVPDA